MAETGTIRTIPCLNGAQAISRSGLRVVPVTHLIILAIMTLSLYLPVWTWRRGSQIERLGGTGARWVGRAYAVVHIGAFAFAVATHSKIVPKSIVAAAAVLTCIALRRSLLLAAEREALVLPVIDRGHTWHLPFFYLQAKLNEMLRLNAAAAPPLTEWARKARAPR